MNARKLELPAAGTDSVAPANWRLPRGFAYARRCAIACVLMLWAYGPVMHSAFLFDDTAQIFALPTATGARLPSWIGVVRPGAHGHLLRDNVQRISFEDTLFVPHGVNTC